MKIEKVHGKIRYTLSNDDNKVGDSVYPIGNGRCLDDGSFIFHTFNFESCSCGFPDEPHIIKNIKHSDYKPYEVQTNFGFSPKERYFKIIKKERHEKVNVNNEMFTRWEWVEFEN